MERIQFYENGLYFVAEITASQDIHLLHFSAIPYEERSVKETDKQAYRLFELQATGENRMDHHGLRYLNTFPGLRMKYVLHQDYFNEIGRKIEIVTSDEVTGLQVTTHFQFYNTISVVGCSHEIENKGPKCVGIEYISSFALLGISKEGLLSDEDKMRVYIPHHCWQGEIQWKQYRLSELGFNHVADQGLSSKRISITSTGSWSASEYLPMAYIENIETGSNLFFQIEHNGSWHWEMSDSCHQLSLLVSGPSEVEHHFWSELRPHQKFTTVPVCIGSTMSGFDGAMSELTKYRRCIRRENEDNKKLPVIFNDYMNCLWGDPTTEKLLPLIAAAAEVGCEYFCIDAGWYADGAWWDEVGEWLPSAKRFPGGIKEVTDYIRAKQMIPGLWLEIEVMGINSPKLRDTDDSWFFMRHGKRVIDRSRYQLDFRNCEVRQYATSVINRLVSEYGVGYIKMDYNINAGIGTETGADSFGEGLLQHNRSYLSWLDEIFEKYPDLIIENCSSGGMRMDYAMLKRHSIQSTSDQTDYKKYAVIAANTPSAVTPEQAAIWSYPMIQSSHEEIIFNMVNAMLFRIHQSGHMSVLEKNSKALVAEGLRYYKTIREDIQRGLPFWPLGFASMNDEWAAVGLKCDTKTYVAVWRIKSLVSSYLIPIGHLKEMEVSVSCNYPSENGKCHYTWHAMTGNLSIVFEEDCMARIFELTSR
ncbi:MAG: glycoside hydrolase clan [Clostridia bacterium]|jgi:alpha-galactosidase|nr:glycoside hydrolase clan [Clostridia bacterium]